MAKRYVCKACNRGCKRGVMHVCEQTCDGCMSAPPCAFSGLRIPCESCHRNFRSRACFDRHKTTQVTRGKTVCDAKRNCATCGRLIGEGGDKKHECFKSYCLTCKRKVQIGHLCYMPVLKDEVPRCDKVLFVFYDFETTQDTEVNPETGAKLHVPNLVCVQQFCSECDASADIDVDCARCGQRRHSFWDDPVGDLMSYLCRARPWARKVVAIAHNAKSFDSHFILNRAVLMRWKPELVMNGLKIVCMKIEHMVFLDSASYLPMPLRKLPEAFGLTVSKSWYPHYFNTRANLDYVGPIPAASFYGADEMSPSERSEFLEWYAGQQHAVFDNRRVLEQYCQDDVTVLRQACQIFRREFMEIGHIEVFLESFTIASACNKVLRKRFLKPDTVGIIPAGGYSCNNNYSKKALMWLLQVEQAERCSIRHARNGREVRLPEVPQFSVDGYCEETRTVYEFYGCFWHGHTCQPYRDVKTMSGETLADRYERTMTRLEQITRAGYVVQVQWECEFDEAGVSPEVRTHPIVEESPLKTRDALYGGRTEAMRLHHKAGDDETVQYVDVISLYPYVCKYFKFPIGHPVIHVGDACLDKDAMLEKEGLIKCRVLPPERLYHPVLPFRCNNKLLFCLCRSCAVERNIEDDCAHETADERGLTGTWVLDEVRRAVEKGYKVLEVFEVYEYDVTRYDPQTGQGGLFVEYINTFLKLKTTMMP